MSMGRPEMNTCGKCRKLYAVWKEACPRCKATETWKPAK